MSDKKKRTVFETQFPGVEVIVRDEDALAAMMTIASEQDGGQLVPLLLHKKKPGKHSVTYPVGSSF